MSEPGTIQDILVADGHASEGFCEKCWRDAATLYAARPAAYGSQTAAYYAAMIQAQERAEAVIAGPGGSPTRPRMDPATMSREREFGYAVREARVAAGISLREAAALFGITAVRMGEVERGVRELEWRHIATHRGLYLRGVRDTRGRTTHGARVTGEV